MTLRPKDKQIVIASHNEGKILEISSFLTPFGISAISAKMLNLPIPEENGNSYFHNALIKAKACTLATGLPCLADDSGIEVRALGGGPGVDTAPYTNSLNGFDKVFALWARSPKVQADAQATFVCVQVLMQPDGHYKCFEGIVSGHLTFPPRGNGGHGYDPIFIPDGHHHTIAEMSLKEKNSCSHRALALEKLLNSCGKSSIFAISELSYSKKPIT
jgi:XTP/dITP diphosphohydrolase